MGPTNVIARADPEPTDALKQAENYIRMVPEQIETNVRRRLKEEFGWRSFEEYRNGFLLDENTFIKADDAKIQMVERKIIGKPLKKSENVPMLILTNVIEMIVDNKGRILGVEKRPQLGLWLNAINRAMRNSAIAAKAPDRKRGECAGDAQHVSQSRQHAHGVKADREMCLVKNVSLLLEKLGKFESCSCVSARGGAFHRT